MRIILYILVSITIWYSNTVRGQQVEFTKENFPTKKEELKIVLKNMKDADNMLEMDPPNYTEAVNRYMLAQQFNPNNADLNKKIADCYFNVKGTKIKSIPFYEKALALSTTKDFYTVYHLAQAYHLNMEFSRAIETYTDAQQLLDAKSSDNIMVLDDIKKKLQECKTGIALVAKPVRVFIDNIGPNVNTADPEYAPCISADESMMIFTSRRNNTTGGGLDTRINDFFEDIYISYNLNGSWSSPINPGLPLNSNSHDGSVALSNDGQKLIIFNGDGSGDLFECTLNGTTWSKPVPYKKPVNTDMYEPSASFSPDYNTLYFVSDRPEGKGKLDIYFSKIAEKGKWGAAVNLGDVINTPYREDAIFLHPDGKTLYFSSEGHNTMGGYDIFKTVYEEGKWSTPENLGYPINTAGDDVFLTVSASGKHGYYSSAKNGGFGEQDIYVITFLGPEKEVILNKEDNLLASIDKPIQEVVVEKPVEVGAALTLLRGYVLDEVTKNALFGEIVLTDNETNTVIATFESNKSTGKYLVSLPSGKNYGIAVKAEGYLFHSENIDIKESKSFQEINKDIYLKKIDIGKKIVLRNIFFDLDKATLRPESVTELENLTKLMVDNPTLKIEISGHTDSQGSDAYNLKLSDNRAKAVVDYLIKKGIAADRLVWKGYGETDPMATNDNETGRQLNRRTEFKILSK